MSLKQGFVVHLELLALVAGVASFGGGIERAVMMALLFFANADGHCFPSIATLASKTEFSGCAVRKAIARLAGSGWLHIERVHDGKMNLSNRYTLNVAQMKASQGERVESSAEPTASRDEVLAESEKGTLPQLVPLCPTASTPLSESETNKAIEQIHVTKPLNKETNTEREKAALESVERPSLEQCKEIYKAYPRHEAPAAAQKAIAKALVRLMRGEGSSGTRMTLQEASSWLLARTETFAASRLVQTTEKKFIKHPATWFNGECYLEEVHDWNTVRADGREHAGRQAQRSNGNGSASAEQRRQRDRDILEIAQRAVEAGYRPLC